MRKAVLRLTFPCVIRNTAIKYIKRLLKLYINYEVIFGFLYNLHKLQENVRGNVIFQIYFCIKLNSNLHEIDLYEELNLFRKIVL